jgi:hypothetical protein
MPDGPQRHARYSQKISAFRRKRQDHHGVCQRGRRCRLFHARTNRQLQVFAPIPWIAFCWLPFIQTPWRILVRTPTFCKPLARRILVIKNQNPVESRQNHEVHEPWISRWRSQPFCNPQRRSARGVPYLLNILGDTLRPCRFSKDRINYTQQFVFRDEDFLSAHARVLYFFTNFRDDQELFFLRIQLTDS